MSVIPPESYRLPDDGKDAEPFVFVSYSHSDAEVVKEDIAFLLKSGVKVFYDQGAGFGVTVGRSITNAIGMCVAVLFFESLQSANSAPVANEIRLAEEAGKRVIKVEIQKTKAADRNELVTFKVMSQNGIFRDTNALAAYRERLLRELNIAPPSMADLLRAKFGAHLRKRGFTEGWSDFFRGLCSGLPDGTEAACILSEFGLGEEGPGCLEKMREIARSALGLGEITQDDMKLGECICKKEGIALVVWETIVHSEILEAAKELKDAGRMAEAREVLSCAEELQLFSSRMADVLRQLPSDGDDPTPEEGRRRSEGASQHLAPPRGGNATSRDDDSAVGVPKHEAGTPNRSKPPAGRVPDIAVTIVSDSLRIYWHRIPEGSFWRGCPRQFVERLERSYPHVMNLRSSLEAFVYRQEVIGEFWMSRTCITEELYSVFRPGSVTITGRDLPVVSVPLDEARACAAWMGASLPSFAQFEKAARGTEGQVYPWGDNFEAQRCNSLESNLGRRTPVDLFPEGASTYGVLDLVGNVWEWTSDITQAPLVVGGSYCYNGEIYGAPFASMQCLAPTDTDLGFRMACADPRNLKFATDFV